MNMYASAHPWGRKPGAALFTVVQSPEVEPGPARRRGRALRGLRNSFG